MKVYILTQVNGYAQLLSLTPYTNEDDAKREMRRQYEAELEDNVGYSHFIDTIHAEICRFDDEWTYSWDITTIDTDNL